MFLTVNACFKSSKRLPSPVLEKKPEEKKEVKKIKLKKMTINYDYFDAGNHWCKHCIAVFSNIHDYLFHLGSKKHQQVLKTDLVHVNSIKFA